MCVIIIISLDFWLLAATISYRSVGCWKDTATRAIPSLEGKDTKLDLSYTARKDAIRKCYEAAKQRGYKYFAVQNGGWCAGSANAENTYKKYGASSACRADGEGGPWANQVYRIGGTPGMYYSYSLNSKMYILLSQ